MLGTYQAARQIDPYSPTAPTHIERSFNEGREIPEERVVEMFEAVLSSDLLERTGRLDDVTRALQKVEKLRGMSVVEVKGFGRRDEGDSHQSVDDLKDFAPYSKVEIFCHENLVEELISVIEKHAYTGLRGDGKIYVSDLDKAFKIGKGRIG